MWGLPDVKEVNQYGDTYEGKNYCLATWDNENTDAIWDLSYHPFKELLLSIGSSVIVWDCKDAVNGQKTHTVFKIKNQTSEPTCGSWLYTQMNQFCVGYQDSTLAIFDAVS